MPGEDPTEGDNAASAGPIDAATVRIHYLKSSLFRVVLSDGAWGGVTPANRIVMNFYNHRAPIPKSQLFEIEKDGRLGSEVIMDRCGLDGMVREVEVAVNMDVSAAKALAAWLVEKVALIEEREKQAKETE